MGTERSNMRVCAHDSFLGEDQVTGEFNSVRRGVNNGERVHNINFSFLELINHPLVVK